MASSAVYYKFKSQRESQRLPFDGTSISVWELKREIILRNKLGKGTDFDLAVYNADTEDEFKDDNYTIPRSSHVIVRRLPASRPGRGTAQLYVSDLQAPGAAGGAPEARAPGGMAGAGGLAGAGSRPYRGPMTKRFDGRDVSGSPAPPGAAPGAPAPPGGPQVSSAALDSSGDEASRIAAMFQATSEQWDETQERMAHATYRERSGMPRRGPAPGGRGGFAPPPVERPPPPPGYICYRCGQKGHWIQECPTNDNQEYDNRPRFKRTTGIPKSMLKTVEQSTAEKMSGVMVTPDGSYVIATPDSSSWNRTRARSRPLSQTDVYHSVPSDPSLACPLCSKLMRDAVITPCCRTTFCEECVQTHLFEHDFLCPECEKPIRNIEEIKIDDAKRKRVREYVSKTIERSEQAVEQGSVGEAHGDAAAAADAEAAAAAGDAPEATDGQEAAKDGKPEAGQPAAEQSRDEKAPDARDSGAGAGGNANAAGNAPPGAPQFDPALVQQLVVMLQNPNLPMPMRMQMQMQLQFQQMLFFQSFPPAPQGGNGGGPPGMPPFPPMGMFPPGMPGAPPGGAPPPGPPGCGGAKRRRGDRADSPGATRAKAPRPEP